MTSRSNLSDRIILIKGAGEKSSAVAHHLHQKGFKKIIMTDLAHPLAERRGVCFGEAIPEGRKAVEGVVSLNVPPILPEIRQSWDKGWIPVIVDPHTEIQKVLRPEILIDGVMAKRNTGTTIKDAKWVIALGPGFTAGKDAHLVVETNPASPDLGKVIFEGPADEDTGRSTPVLGLTWERLIISPGEGILRISKAIGDPVRKNEPIAVVDGLPILAPIHGVIWGLIRDGLPVKKGQKIGDIDPRGKRKTCFKITPQAGLIAEGVLKGLYKFFILEYST